MKAANSPLVTGARAIRNGAIVVSCAHFSLSNTKPSAAVDPSRQLPPGTAASAGRAPAAGHANVSPNSGDA